MSLSKLAKTVTNQKPQPMLDFWGQNLKIWHDKKKFWLKLLDFFVNT